MPWYAVHTNARAEWLAHTELRRQGYETLYLHYLAAVSHGRRSIVVNRPYYPRYLFALVDVGQSVYAVNKTQGVSTVVYAGADPLEIPERVIAEQRTKGDRNGLVKLTGEERHDRERIASGAEVKLLSGTFAGFAATVALDEGKELRVWLNLLNRRVAATVPESAVVHPSGGAL